MWKAYANIKDSGDNVSTLRFALDPASGDTDFVANLAALAAMVDDLEAITLGAVIAYGLTWEVPQATTPTAGSEVEAIGLISGRIDATEEKWATLRIPAPVDGIFVAATGPSRNVVDPTDSALLAYLGNFESGSGSFFLSDGEQLDTPGATTVKGKRIHRGSRNG